MTIFDTIKCDTVEWLLQYNQMRYNSTFNQWHSIIPYILNFPNKIFITFNMPDLSSYGPIMSDISFSFVLWVQFLGNFHLQYHTSQDNNFKHNILHTTYFYKNVFLGCLQCSNRRIFLMIQHQLPTQEIGLYIHDFPCIILCILRISNKWTYSLYPVPGSYHGYYSTDTL